MNGVNQVNLLGNLGGEPKEFSGGCRFSIATNNAYTNKGGEKVQETDWHNCVVFGKSADVLLQYAKKGSTLYIDGRIKYGKYNDKDGIEKYSTDIIVNQWQFVGSKNVSENERQSYDSEVSREQANEHDDIPF